MYKKFFKYLVIILASITLLELFSYGFLNIYVRFSKSVKGDISLVQYWEFDPYLLWIPKKSIQGYDKYSHFRMNNYGFRNNYDITKEKQANVVRIIAVGGSVSWGSGVSSNDTVWTKILEDKLQSEYTNRRVEVLNAGCAGYLSFQELSYLLFRLLQFSPDIVIVMDGYNDVFMSAFYPQDKYQANVSVYYDAEKRFFDDPLLFQILELIGSKSNFFRLLSRAREKILYETGKPVQSISYGHNKGIENYFNNIKSISDILNGRNIKSIFLLQPYMGMTKKVLSKDEEKMRLKNKESNPLLTTLISILQKEYREFAEKNRINYYDTINIFDNLTSSETVWYDHIHLNDLGHRILAEQVSKIIIEKGLID